MDMFVTIKMSWLDSGGFHFVDLGVPLLLDFAQHDVAFCDAKQQGFRSAIELARVIHQAVDSFRLGDRSAITEIQVYAKAEAGGGPSEFHAGRESCTVGQK